MIGGNWCLGLRSVADQERPPGELGGTGGATLVAPITGEPRVEIVPSVSVGVQACTRMRTRMRTHRVPRAVSTVHRITHLYGYAHYPPPHCMRAHPKRPSRVFFFPRSTQGASSDIERSFHGRGVATQVSVA